MSALEQQEEYEAARGDFFSVCRVIASGLIERNLSVDDWCRAEYAKTKARYEAASEAVMAKAVAR